VLKLTAGECHARPIGLDRPFATADARVKLKHLYPKVKE